MINQPCSQSIRLAALAALLLSGAAAMGDTIYIQSTSAGKPLKRDNVTINKIAKDDEGEKLFYTTDGGSTGKQDLAKIVQIEAEGEPAFNKAEAEYASGDFKSAGEDYRRAMGASTKDWLKHRADVRVLGISAKTGDFLGAVAGYVTMARTDPAGAASHEPDIAAAKKEELSSAIASVNQGLAGVGPDAKRVLYPFLVKLYNKNGDTAGATTALNVLKTLSPQSGAAEMPTPGGTAAPDTSGAALAQKQAEADIALTKATAAFTAKDYAKTIADINAASPSFVDPEHQARALYLIAQSKAATATTPEALQDTAVAYMRVVAHFKSQPNGPAADALYQTGVIEERLSKPTEALLIYNQVINEYGDSKAAEQAKAAVARLKK